MQRLVFAIVSVALSGVAAVGTAQTSDVAICDGIATQIRENPEIASGSGIPLSLLSKGDRPYIQLPSKPDISVTGKRTQFAELFRQEFQPSEALADALDRFPENLAEVFSLPGSDLHMIETFGGTASCASFLFFWTSKGGRSQLLPGLPDKGVRDGDNLICSGSGDDGNLARVAGTDVFLEVMASPTDNDYDFRVVPFHVQEGKWGAACEIKAHFHSEYSVSKVFVPTQGPVSEMELKDVAAKIVELHAAAKDPKLFSFGAPVPETEKQNVRTMIDLADRTQKEAVPVPAFGRENELGAYERSLGDVDSYPLVLGRKAYLMMVGHGAIGWRVSSESGLILFILKDGKLQPVGTAIVGQSLGALWSVHTAEWKIRGGAR